jgi:alkylated DNA repair dioxygenase AlkB
MDPFVSRKRQRLASPPKDISPPVKESTLPMKEDQEDTTDIKLAILASLDPTTSNEELLDLLIACDGSVEVASAILIYGSTTSIPPRKKSSSVGLQSSLPFLTSRDALLSRPSKAPKNLTRKGRTVHLFTADDIAAHTPCSIIHNFLPSEEATSLLKELLAEASTFRRATFQLFDKIVQSRSSAGFYVNSLEEQEKHTREYLYNGSHLSDVRELLPEMRKVYPKVKDAVNKEITIRIRDHYPDGRKLKYQCPDEWVPNAAVVNCYDGGSESVGYHSDQLTYLGPRAVIGSLSLGVSREFRVRKIIGREEDEGSTDTTKTKDGIGRSRADEEGQIAIHLPHNSLLVMHADMQEEWKHSIHPALTVDPHPVAGNKRINITYRWYRESFHPRDIPKCKCGVATVLKVVQKRKENRGRYMWMCQVGSIPGKETCGFFDWAEFTDGGEPLWKPRSR